MEPADARSHHWTGILLSASLLTAWCLPAAAQSTTDASLFTTTQKPLAKPTIAISSNTVTEYKERVTFYCRTTEINISIRWVFQSQTLVLKERMQLSADAKMLTFLTVQREDSGTYQCEISDGLNVQSSDTIFLEVNYGPDAIEIKLEPGVPSGEEVEVMEGSTVIFQAETQSHPDPIYSWIYPNDFTLSSKMGTLTIHTVSTEHEGMFRCLVFNNATHLSRLGALRVRVLQNLTKPQVEASSLNLVENAGPVNLTCQTTHQRVGVQWFVNDQPLLPSQRLALSDDNMTLVIHDLRRDDTGPYECEIWHWGSRARSDPLLLTINYGPDRVDITRGSSPTVVSTIWEKLDSNLTLQCRAESQPQAEYRWVLEHSTGVHMGEQLVIGPLTWEHEGICSCTALNPLTRVASSASVLIRVDPESSSLSAGAIAGIVIGVLVLIAVVAGLGYFFYTKYPRPPKTSADDPAPKATPLTSVGKATPPASVGKATPPASVGKATPPTSVREHPMPPSSYIPRPAYDYVPAPRGRIGVGKKLPPELPEQFYEKEPPSANPGDFSSSPRKPPPKLPVQPIEDTEDSYEILVNPEPEVYCRINPSV